MSTVTNILIAGVGGQGILLAGDVIGLAAQLAGLQVKASEVHGMSQRGGSVVSEVRFGAEVFSPLIPPPGADFLLAFELLEGARGLAHLRPGGTAIVNRQRILPASVTYGAQQYPPELEAQMARECPQMLLVDATALANALGNARVVNSILMGVLASQAALPRECWDEALRRIVKPKFLALNRTAFDQGYQLATAEIRS